MNLPLELLSHHEAVVLERSDRYGHAILHVREVVCGDAKGPEGQTTRADDQDLADAALAAFSQDVLEVTGGSLV